MVNENARGKKLGLIDISSFMHRSYHGVPNTPDLKGNNVNMIKGCMSMIMKLLRTNDFTHVIIAKDPGGKTIRHEIFSDYKGHRPPTPDDFKYQKPFVYIMLEKMGIKIIEKANYEADDVIGSIAKQWKDDFEQIVIVSGDKDLLQYASDNVWMLDTMKNKIYSKKTIYKKYGIEPHQISDYLSIVGDVADNIPGVKGIGPVRAADLLRKLKNIDNIIKNYMHSKHKVVRERFRDYMDNLILSRKLVKIYDDLDLECFPDDSIYKFDPSHELGSFLQSFGLIETIKYIKRSHPDWKFQENTVPQKFVKDEDHLDF